VRTDARKMLAAKRSDVEIVGDELHPLLKITDFSPSPMATPADCSRGR
jgi:branched-chain amino acid transport system substrate-binding protein